MWSTQIGIITSETPVLLWKSLFILSTSWRVLTSSDPFTFTRKRSDRHVYMYVETALRPSHTRTSHKEGKSSQQENL